MGATQKNIPITIAAGASLSNPALIGDHTLVGMLVPASWTSAVFTFQISFDEGVTFYNLYDDGGNEVTLSPTLIGSVAQYLALSPDPYGGATMLKVRSGTQGSPVNQTAAAAIELVTKKIFPIR
jgi:hypothetical protein